jgi:hypothetical protein
MGSFATAFVICWVALLLVILILGLKGKVGR